MTDSDILQALIAADIAMTGKGYPMAQMNITADRRRRDRPWTVTLYLEEDQPVSAAQFIGRYADALTAIFALAKAVESVEPRPRDWTLAEIAATLGIDAMLDATGFAVGAAE